MIGGKQSPSSSALLTVNGMIWVGSNSSLSCNKGGLLRYNTGSNAMEFCNGSVWQSMSGNSHWTQEPGARIKNINSGSVIVGTALGVDSYINAGGTIYTSNSDGKSFLVYQCPYIRPGGCAMQCIGQLSYQPICRYWTDVACTTTNKASCTQVGYLVGMNGPAT